MATKLKTSNYQYTIANQFIDDIETNNYYLFVGDHNLSNTTVADLTNRQKDLFVDCYRNMIMGKKIANTNVKFVIRNIPYETNVVYDMYDDEDDQLEEKDFYVIVDEGSYFHIYKCLDNNNGANSTAIPTFSHISGSNTEVYQTSDGYRWKYMYTVSDAIAADFESVEYFPISANSNVTDDAVDGALDVILIEDGGKRYDNYITGTFVTDDLRVNGNNTLYKISSSGASITNGYYTDCLLYISAGSGAGAYRTITNYISNANGNFVVLNSSLTTPTNGSQYQIYPKIEITGSGTETVNAVARALINSSSSNSIYRVEFLERGQNYTFATARPLANSVVPVSREADLRVIHPPKGGHGYDVYKELYTKAICIGLSLSNSESNTILTTNGFKQLGIIKNPLFSNVYVEFSNTSSTFTADDIAYKISPVLFQTNATINTTSGAISANNGDFVNQLASNTKIYIKTGNGTSHSIATINNVVNSSVFNITTNGSFACTETLIYFANIIHSSNISSVVSATEVYLNNVNGSIETDDIIVSSGGVHGVVNTVVRNDVSKSFNTFVQAYKYVGAIESGTFINNEIVFQEELSTSNALLHSVVNNGSNVEMYTTRQNKLFTGNSTIVGNTSDAVFTITTQYNPELVPGSGDVIYIENRSPINRANNLTETFKIYFET